MIHRRHVLTGLATSATALGLAPSPAAAIRIGDAPRAAAESYRNACGTDETTFHEAVADTVRQAAARIGITDETAIRDLLISTQCPRCRCPLGPDPTAR